MASNKFKIILWSLGIIMLIFLGFFLYQLTQSESVNSIMILLMLLLGLILGGVITFLASKKLVSEPSVITESSHTIAESMRKVFKVVSAEGHFNEIYNYEETTKLFNFIPSKKKALVIVQAKVLVGYDFEKFQWEVDEQNRRVKLLNFPAPEILFEEDALISITGADLCASINGLAITAWRTLFVKKNSVLKFEQPITGSRAYLAVAGG